MYKIQYFYEEMMKKHISLLLIAVLLQNILMTKFSNHNYK